MEILKVYADIMDEVPKLEKDYKLSYDEALRRAKEIYIDELKKLNPQRPNKGKSTVKTMLMIF